MQAGCFGQGTQPWNKQNRKNLWSRTSFCCYFRWSKNNELDSRVEASPSAKAWRKMAENWPSGTFFVFDRFILAFHLCNLGLIHSVSLWDDFLRSQTHTWASSNTTKAFCTEDKAYRQCTIARCFKCVSYYVSTIVLGFRKIVYCEILPCSIRIRQIREYQLMEAYA